MGRIATNPDSVVLPPGHASHIVIIRTADPKRAPDQRKFDVVFCGASAL